MPALPLGTPVSTESPTFLVEDAKEPGTYTYTLVVVDGAGNRSEPARVSVNVVRKASGG